MLLKDSWWSKNTDRRKHGKELREVFLDTHALKIDPETSSRQNEIQSKIMEDKDIVFCLSNAEQPRTLKPAESYYLLPLDLMKYMRAKEIAEYCWVKTKDDDEILKHQYAISIADSQRNYSTYLDKVIEIMNEQLVRYTKIFRKRKESFRQKRALVDAAYESRKVYINSLASDRAKRKEKGKKN